MKILRQKEFGNKENKKAKREYETNLGGKKRLLSLFLDDDDLIRRGRKKQSGLSQKTLEKLEWQNKNSISCGGGIHATPLENIGEHRTVRGRLKESLKDLDKNITERGGGRLTKTSVKKGKRIPAYDHGFKLEYTDPWKITPKQYQHH